MATKMKEQTMPKEPKPTTSIALFQEQSVRRVWYEEKWFFSIIDVIAILTDSPNPRRYWSDLKRDLDAEGFREVYALSVQLKMLASDGKMRVTDAADTQTLLRIIQSVRSLKAEPFKRWLAEVGTQRIEEIENPEMAMERMRRDFEQKGYSQTWIEARMRGIAVRDELTEEWRERGAKEGLEYAILTNEIARATFGMNIQDHKALKRLKKENIRDHMTDLELILTMLGEATSTRLHQDRDTQGFDNLQVDAKEAGEVAGSTRRDIESRTGTPVVSPSNYLHLTKSKKKKQLTKDTNNPPPIQGEE
jgi:DNA-damage-inducible protein D